MHTRSLPPLLLAVIGVGAVFAEVVFVAERFGDRPGGRVNRDGLPGHGSGLFPGGSHMRGLRYPLSPAERSVTGNQAGGACERTNALHAGNNGSSGVGLVVLLNLLTGELGGDRDLTVEVVGLCGAEAWNLTIGLRPCSGV